MSDSLLLQKLSEVKLLQDTLSSQVSHIDSIVSSIKGESWFYKLLPLIGVLLGGFITWWTQKQLKERELRLTIFKELKDTSNKILSSLTNLQFQLKELAYLEVDSKHQFHIYCTSEEESERERAYEEHYNDYKYIADVKNKISLFVADITSNFAAYYKLSNTAIPNSVQNLLSTFTTHILNLPREKPFQKSLR